MTEQSYEAADAERARVDELVDVLCRMTTESAFGRGWVVQRLALGRSAAEMETIVAAADLAISRWQDAERGRRRPSVTEIDDAP